VDKAKAGDMPAIKELLTRLLGKPAESPDPDGLTIDIEGIIRREYERWLERVDAEADEDAEEIAEPRI
jgi:hypothetical protein